MQRTFCDLCEAPDPGKVDIGVYKANPPGKAGKREAAIIVAKELCDHCTDRLAVAVGNLVTGIFDGSITLVEPEAAEPPDADEQAALPLTEPETAMEEPVPVDHASNGGRHGKRQRATAG